MGVFKKIVSSILSGVFISLGASLYLVLREYDFILACGFFSVGILLTSLYADRLFTRVVPIYVASWRGKYRITDIIYILSWKPCRDYDVCNPIEIY